MTARRRAAAVAAIAAIAGAVVYARCAAHRDVAAPVVRAPSSIPRVRLAELRHRAPSSIAGVVTSAGAPVATATVCARANDEAPRCAPTGADGTWELAELPPAAYAIWASAPGFGGGAAQVTTSAGEHRGDVRITLLAGAVELHGTVRDVRGAPIAGAVLQISIDARTPPTYAAHSDATGAFSAWALPGDAHVAASANGFVDADVDTIAPDAAIAIAMTPGGSIAGSVIDATTRAPIADADVDVDGERAQTDAAGQFRVGKLRPGRYKPSATSIGGYGEAAESVRVGLGAAIAGIVIEIHPVAVVAGHVVIAEGDARQPCAADRGEVWLDRHGGAASYLARTLDDGQVLLEGVVPGTYGVVAKCRGYLSAVPYPDLIVGDSDVDDVTWLVSRGARVAGRVRARGGEPIAGATVNARSTDGASFATAHAGSDGEFVVDGLRAGAASIDASADGFLATPQSVPAVAAIGDAARCEVVLDRGGAITGVVVDERGDPAPGAPVTLREGGADGPQDAAVRADRGGAFRFDALAPGAYRVAVESELGEHAEHGADVTVVASATANVRVVAPDASGAIDGVVRDAAGGAVSDAYVEIALEDDATASSFGPRYAWSSAQVLAGIDGSFHFADLPRGRYGLRARRPGGAETIVAHVALGDRIAIVLAPTGVLAGVVVSASGAPITDVVITAADRAHDISRDERAYFTGGRFALRDLPAGTYKLTVDGDPGSAVVVPLADGERREDLQLVMQPRYTLRGRLVSSQGAPLAGWRIDVPRVERIEHGADHSTVTAAIIENAVTTGDGAFVVHDLPAGATTISGYDPARAADADAVVVRDVTLGGLAAVVDAGDVATP